MIKIFQIFEVRIRNLLINLNLAKDEMMYPWIRSYWPLWLTPNVLTIIRMVIGLPILLPLVYFTGFVGNYTIFVFLVIAALTDLVDGPVARALNIKSPLGSLLDKIADKLLVVPIGVYEFWFIDKPLAVLSIAGMTVVMYTSVSRFFHSDYHDVPENIYGKWATCCYCVAIILPILRDVWFLGDSWEWASKLGWMGFALGLASATLNFRKHYDMQT